jgi:predicted neuraminidase
MKKILLIILIAILCFNKAQAQFSGEQCIIKSEFIYQPEDVSFPSCHASTIVRSGKGLLAAWFGGTHENNPDVEIWISKWSKGRWSKPVSAASGVQHSGKRYPCWNPVLHNTGKEILLFYKVGPSPSTWWGEMKISENGGKTWSRALRLPEDILGPVKNKPVLLDDGYLLCPSSSEHDGWKLHMEFTSDNGLTWERTQPLNNDNVRAIQPSVLIHPDGKLQLLCRSGSSRILTAWSDDKGRSWSNLTPASLPNPNSGIDAVTLKDGRHIVVYNHIERGRNMLNLAVSSDGINWEAAALLENDVKGSEFSYPAIIEGAGNLIHITYTWNRKLIKHTVIDPELIESRKFQDEAWPESF